MVYESGFSRNREGNGTPLQCSCLENPMDGGAWWAAVHGVAKSRTRLSFTFTFHFHALEKEWQPPPVFLPGESQGLGSLVGCRLWGRTESDMTEATAAGEISVQFFFFFVFWVWKLRYLKKAMAPHSSTLAWKIPWTEKPGRLQSMGSLRVGHD